MSTQHTPGPWWVSGDIPGEGATQFPVVRAFINGTQAIQVCRVGNMNQYKGRGGRDWPNARLIAAAPDLLEALDCCMGTLSQCFPAAHVDSVIGKNISRARAAIAKAEGGAA